MKKRTASADRTHARRQAKTERIDLGLALLSIANSGPRVPLSAHQIATWCDCSHQAISQIEHVALGKLNRLFSRRLREG